MDAQDEDTFDDADDDDKTALDELRSLVFQACEVLVSKSTLATFRPLSDQMIQFASKFAAYDPDYFSDDQNESDNEEEESTSSEMKDSEDNGGDDMMGDDGECFSGEDFSGSDFGDDGFASTSWKVRRDVLRCLVAVANVSASSVDIFGAVISQIVPLIIKRTKDHDENVRAEALSPAHQVRAGRETVDDGVAERTCIRRVLESALVFEERPYPLSPQVAGLQGRDGMPFRDEVAQDAATHGGEKGVCGLGMRIGRPAEAALAVAHKPHFVPAG